MITRNSPFHYGDMIDFTNLIELVHETQLDEIYNLAAQSHVQVSFETPEYTANADGIGTRPLLEAIWILDRGDKARFYLASTSELFGLVRARRPCHAGRGSGPASPAAMRPTVWAPSEDRDFCGVETEGTPTPVKRARAG